MVTGNTDRLTVGPRDRQVIMSEITPVKMQTGDVVLLDNYMVPSPGGGGSYQNCSIRCIHNVWARGAYRHILCLLPTQGEMSRRWFH